MGPTYPPTPNPNLALNTLLIDEDPNRPVDDQPERQHRPHTSTSGDLNRLGAEASVIGAMGTCGTQHYVL
jgi:hypothetical protein